MSAICLGITGVCNKQTPLAMLLYLNKLVISSYMHIKLSLSILIPHLLKVMSVSHAKTFHLTCLEKKPVATLLNHCFLYKFHSPRL